MPALAWLMNLGFGGSEIVEAGDDTVCWVDCIGPALDWTVQVGPALEMTTTVEPAIDWIQRVGC